MIYPIRPNDVIRSKRSHGKYVREARIINVDAAGMVLYDILEHWGNPRKGKVTEFLYRHIDKIVQDYEGLTT